MQPDNMQESHALVCKHDVEALQEKLITHQATTCRQMADGSVLLYSTFDYFPSLRKINTIMGSECCVYLPVL